MEERTRLSKEQMAQEVRYILQTLAALTQYGDVVNFEQVQNHCQSSLHLHLQDYLVFLDRYGYLLFDEQAQRVNITSQGMQLANGDREIELLAEIAQHFRALFSRSSRATGRKTSALVSPEGGYTEDVAALPKDENSLIDDRYEKQQLIGSGGIGTVYLARQLSTDRDVAFKEIRELFNFFVADQQKEIRRRFGEEALKAARLKHANIAHIIDGNINTEFPYIVSELVSGGNLRQLMTRPIAPDVTVKLLLQILHGLAHAHAQGVIHRGLKPENILFDELGNVRLTDFGLAKVVERDQEVIQHVYVGMGSVAYMAPELFNLSQKPSPASDLYALGIIFYEMLAGRLPGRRSPMPSKIHPTLPKVIDDLFDRLTQDEVGDRYKGADEVLEDFYQADAIKAFLDHRQGVLFLHNPLKMDEGNSAAQDRAKLTISQSLRETSNPTKD